jgi:hypothetical protein
VPLPAARDKRSMKLITERYKIVAVKNPATKRYECTCPICGRVTERSNRAGAEHNATVHLIYQ